ncbi:hypothetical protein H5410_016845 [Solanum commersonii]|uniref:Uncharacterized protein n=1 Tax=Solanum commersonii TaxID=4109 RepID=A0A9J5ZXE2_SOLCO|nr:hypothetical protein H5410_016845 [Solanum commersonii]
MRKYYSLNQEVSGSSSLEYRIVFVRERFTLQCGTSRREFEFSQAPIWVPDTGWKTKIKISSKSSYSKD